MEVRPELRKNEHLSTQSDKSELTRQTPENGPPVLAQGDRELTVLDADHPLMQRFQEALKAMLLKHLDKAEIQLREKNEECKREEARHLEIGCELFNHQQELLKFQKKLADKQQEYEQLSKKADQANEELDAMRDKYNTTSKEVDEESKRMKKYREEIDSLALRIYYLSQAKDEIKGDVNLLSCANAKAFTDLNKIEDEKLQQDLLLDRIQNKVDQLKEEVELYEAQILTQEDELEASERLLHEAEAQIVTISVDRKQLTQHWHSSLLGLQRRNEVYAELTKTYDELKEKLLLAKHERQAYAKSISAEQETHERLTMVQNQNEAQLTTLKKQLGQVKDKNDSLTRQYNDYSAILHETERNLQLVQTEYQDHQAQLDTIRLQLQRSANKKAELETKIKTELCDRLMAKKSIAYVEKLRTTLKDQCRDMVSQLAQMENKIARDELAIATCTAENNRLQERLKEYNAKIDERNAIINKLEVEIHRANIMVERKQNQIDILNRKLEKLLQENEGEELGPLEIAIVKLQRAISTKQEEIGDLEQDWLKVQNELVSSVEERETLSKSISRLNKQLSLAAQKRIRIESEIRQQEVESNEVERELRRLQNDVVRLNSLIAQQRSTGQALSAENKLTELDFIRALRAKEMEAADLRGQFETVRCEKENLMNEMIDLEQTIMFWEKKVQLCDETRRAVESDLGEGEIKVMRHEIHRMEVRKSSLLQQQEKLIRELENSVTKRDNIVTHSEFIKLRRSKTSNKVTAERQLYDLKRRLKMVKEKKAACFVELNMLQQDVFDMTATNDAKQKDVAGKEKEMKQAEEELRMMMDEKQWTLFKLQMRQHETNYWEQIRNNRYRRLFPSIEAANDEKERQLDKSRKIIAVVDKIGQEYPEIKRDLRIVRDLLASHLSTNKPAKIHKIPLHHSSSGPSEGGESDEGGARSRSVSSGRITPVN